MQVCDIKGAVCALALALAGIGSAQAHVYLVRSTPAAGAMLTQAPQRFTLQFSGPVEAKFDRYLLVAGSKSWPLTARHSPADAPVTASGPLPPLGAGQYVLRWSALSRDGHRQEGRIPFTVR